MSDHISHPVFSSNTSSSKNQLVNDGPLKSSKENPRGLTRNNSLNWQHPNKATKISTDLKSISLVVDKKEAVPFTELNTGTSALNELENLSQKDNASNISIKNNKNDIANRRAKRFQKPSFSKLDLDSLEGLNLPEDLDTSEIEFMPKPPQIAREPIGDLYEKPVGEILNETENTDPSSLESQLLKDSKPKFLSNFEKEFTTSFNEEISKKNSEDLLEVDFPELFETPLQSLYFDEADSQPIRLREEIINDSEL